MRFEVCDLGLIEYSHAWNLQDDYAAEIAAGVRAPTLLLLEHPNVYTFGRKGHTENLLWDDQRLKERGIVVQWVDRGGDVTYHGPGQLVGYPILRLPDPMDVVAYVRRIEGMLIDVCAEHGVEAAHVRRQRQVRQDHQQQ